MKLGSGKRWDFWRFARGYIIDWGNDDSKMRFKFYHKTVFKFLPQLKTWFLSFSIGICFTCNLSNERFIIYWIPSEGFVYNWCSSDNESWNNDKLLIKPKERIDEHACKNRKGLLSSTYLNRQMQAIQREPERRQLLLGHNLKILSTTNQSVLLKQDVKGRWRTAFVSLRKKKLFRQPIILLECTVL